MTTLLNDESSAVYFFNSSDRIIIDMIYDQRKDICNSSKTYLSKCLKNFDGGFVIFSKFDGKYTLKGFTVFNHDLCNNIIETKILCGDKESERFLVELTKLYMEVNYIYDWKFGDYTVYPNIIQMKKPRKLPILIDSSGLILK